MRKTHVKKEAIVIATKYRNKEIKVDYYTMTGTPLSKEDVKKESNKKGVRFYYFD